MTSYYQYRITVNGTVGSIINEYPGGERWSSICDVIEARGGKALLEQRLVAAGDMRKLVGDAPGYIPVEVDGELFTVCPWEYLAGYDGG